MTAVPTYIDCFQFMRATTGLEIASLLGNTGRLSSAVIAGATSLPVAPNTTVPRSQLDNLTIFDGPNSEQVMVGANIAANQPSIPLLQPLTFAHAQYVTYCTDGPSGTFGGNSLA